MDMLVIQMLVHSTILRSLLRLLINSTVDTCINQLEVLQNIKYS
nr:MAG TPA: hypothetical protein [Caudoviricetes sp.]